MARDLLLAGRLARDYRFPLPVVRHLLELVDYHEQDARALLDAALHVDIAPILRILEAERGGGPRP